MSSLQSPEHSTGAESQSPPGNDPNLGSIVQNLSDKRSHGNENKPKRRGPKPDSKPALTRRQELNRQAQRTHRERKEQYVKSLEDEVLRIKDLYSQVSRDKDALFEENRHLKHLLMVHGISFNSQPGAATGTSSNFGSEEPRTASSNFSPSPSHFAQQTAPPTQGAPSSAPQGSATVDLEQAGIDFVLKLERPCMSHSHIVDDMVNTRGGPPCGHALMASCAPPAQDQNTPFGSRWTPANSDVKTWDLPKADLARLLDLSSKLELGGEITPVMAWRLVTMDPRILRLTQKDLDELAEQLVQRVRCYGFGAVMEEWEVRDVMANVTSPRVDAMAL